MQTILFETTDTGALVSNYPEIRPPYPIPPSNKYNTNFDGKNWSCDCEHYRHHETDCRHILQLKYTNLQSIYNEVLEKIGEHRDNRDEDNIGLDGAVEKIANHRHDDLYDLIDLVVRIAVQNGTVSSDDLHVVTNEAYYDDKIVGTVFAVMLRLGFIEEVGRKPTVRKCAHGRKINVYRLIEKNSDKEMVF